MHFGALGDLHGDFESARRIMARHPEVPFWLCVGDIADAEGRYEPLPAPLHWIKGNNEGFDAIAAGALPANLFYLPNATLRTIDGIRVAGLGGTFAPTWYDTLAADLPYPGKPSLSGMQAPAARARRRSVAPRSGAAEREASGGGAPRAVKDDKRRHFVRGEVDACKALERIDVLMTHEAPRPYFVGHGSGRAGSRGIDAGKTPVNEVLAAVKPRLHLFGHHHRFTEQDRQGVRSVGLDLVSKSYVIVDAGTLVYELVTL